MKKLFILFLCLFPLIAYADNDTVIDGSSDVRVGRQSVLFYERPTDPGSPSANGIKLFSKDKAGTTTLYVKDSAGIVSEIINTNSFSGLESDPYAVLLAGRSGGQTIKGGTGEGEDLSFWTNATGTVGSYFFTDLTDNGFVKTSGGTGLLSVDTSTYLTSEVDGSVTNELPIAGNLIDISGTPASTVDVDLTEAGDLTWGSGSASTMVHTYNLSGTDVTVTYGSNSVTFSGDLHVTGDTTTRMIKRVTSLTSSATPTINTDTCDYVDITALGTDITSMTTNLSGTPNNKDTLIFEIKDDGTPRAISWGSSFVAGGAPLPTTTVADKILTVGFIYSTANSLNKWRCVASAQEA
jgi:hypothetical protein